MSQDIFENLADSPIPPPPQRFDELVHERLNRRLVAGHVADLALKGLPYALLHFGRAVAGLIGFTITGRYNDESKPRR